MLAVNIRRAFTWSDVSAGFCCNNRAAAPATTESGNPAIGTPHTPALETPPPVIHSAGDAHPGESNPAARVTRPDGAPAVDTAAFLAAENDPQVACTRLVEAANNAGGVDNITAVTIYAEAA